MDSALQRLTLMNANFDFSERSSVQMLVGFLASSNAYTLGASIFTLMLAAAPRPASAADHFSFWETSSEYAGCSSSEGFRVERVQKRRITPAVNFALKAPEL